MRHTRSWALSVTLLACTCLVSPAFLLAQDPQLPPSYELDIQLAEAGRSKFMAGHSEISGTAANQTGEEVFQRLIRAGYSRPYAWKMTIVDNHVVNAGSTPGGQVYVDGGLASLIGQNRGLWAAVLSHEVAHTGRRHQVPASAVSSHDRSVKAAAYVESDGQTIAGSTAFDVHFPNFKRTAIAPTQVAAKPVFQKSAPEAGMQSGKETNSSDRAMMTQWLRFVEATDK